MDLPIDVICDILFQSVVIKRDFLWFLFFPSRFTEIFPLQEHIINCTDPGLSHPYLNTTSLLTNVPVEIVYSVALLMPLVVVRVCVCVHKRIFLPLLISQVHLKFGYSWRPNKRDRSNNPEIDWECDYMYSFTNGKKWIDSSIDWLIDFLLQILIGELGYWLFTSRPKKVVRAHCIGFKLHLMPRRFFRHAGKINSISGDDHFSALKENL